MTSDRIRAAVEEALPSGYGGVASWHGPRTGEWSWTFRVETGGAAPATLLVKVPRWEDATDLADALAAGPQQDTEEEYRALEAIAAAVAASGDPGLAAVVPVAYVPEVNAIVTELLRARPLRDRLRGGRGGRSASAYFRRAGRWLAVFHGSGDRRPRPFLPGEADDFDQIAAHLGGSLGQAASDLVAAGRVLTGRPTLEVVAHGDFSMANILVTIDDRVAVVDPNRYRARPSADVAHLLIEARLSRRQLLSAGIGGRRRTVEAWAAAMSEGYPELDPVLLSYDRAAAAVRRWAEVEERLRGVGRVALVPARRLLRSEVASLLEGI